MTEFTKEKLAELRAVAEAATLPDYYVCDCTALCGGVCPNPKPVYLSIDNETVLALIAALEAANESKPSNSFTSGSANERELADLRAALEAKTAEAQRIPLYAMLDAFHAVTGASHPEWDRLYEKHGYAESWARVIAMVRDAVRERDEARAEASKIEGRAVEWSKRAETAEAAAKYATGRMIDARALLQQMADRIDPFVFDELASELDDQPLDANGDTFEHRLNRAEAALERVRALHESESCIACDGGADCPYMQAIEGADDA